MTPHKKDLSSEQETRGSIYPPMKRALVVSVGVHIVVVLLLIFGLPYVHSKRDIPPIISVELATVADITQTNKAPVLAPKQQEPKEDVKPEPARPTPAPPKADPAPEKEPEEVKKDPPPPDELTPPKKEEKKKEKPKKKEDPKKESAKDLNVLLKNLMKEEAQPKTDITDLTKKLTTSPTPSPVAPAGETLTISDLEALRHQLAGCWNVFAGASGAEDMAVDIRVIVNQNRTVQSASVQDQSRYNSDDRFRAAADSALRAVQNPKCSPLNLPPEKYDVWHDMIINFDPKDML